MSDDKFGQTFHKIHCMANCHEYDFRSYITSIRVDIVQSIFSKCMIFFL